MHLWPEFSILGSSAGVDGVNPFGRLKPGPHPLTLLGRMIRMSDISGEGWTLTGDSMRDGYWPCANLGQNRFVFIWHDWDAQFGEDTGLLHPQFTTATELSNMELLLISSCCSEEEHGVSKRLALEPIEVALCELRRAGYHSTFLEDTDHKLECETCFCCRGWEGPRDVCGLLVYPLENSGKYHRVGMFISRAKNGGSTLFDGVEARKIEIL